MRRKVEKEKAENIWRKTFFEDEKKIRQGKRGKIFGEGKYY